MSLQYDTAGGILWTAMKWKFTIIPMVVLRFEFFLLLGLNIFINIVYRQGILRPSEYHVGLATDLTHITGSLMTFFVVFYNGNVFNRYNKIYELMKRVNEESVVVISMLANVLPNKRVTRKLGRLILASVFVFCYHHIQLDDQEVGNRLGLSRRRWQNLVRMGLIDVEEMRLLVNHCNDVGDTRAMPSFLLLHWAMRLYRTASKRVNDVEKHFYAIRRSQEEVNMILDLPMPFQYFHIMNLMLMLNLCLWAYSLGLQDSYFAPVIFFFVQLMFQGIRELSVALADPFGADETDFPVTEWMSELYVHVLCVIEDPWEAPRHVPRKVTELPMLDIDQDVIEMIDGKLGAWVEPRTVTYFSEAVGGADDDDDNGGMWP